MANKALIGLDLSLTSDVVSQYTSATSSGIDLFHPKQIKYGTYPDDFSLPTTRSDLVYQKDGTGIFKALVGKISPFVDADSEIPFIREISEKSIKEELSWATHLGLPAVSIRVQRPVNANLARLLVNFISTEFVPIKIWLIFPMTIEYCGDDQETGNQANSSQSSLTPWHWWVHLSSLASDITDALGVVLELPKDLPEEAVISRWLSEPVSCILLRTDLFLTNSKGFPVLPKSHQSVIRRFFKLNVQVLLTGACHHDKGYSSYQLYVTWLWKTQTGPDLYEEQSKGLEDQLQEPLQPLRDNLSSTTYSIFEMDPYKYDAYEKAICEALHDRSKPYHEAKRAANQQKSLINGNDQLVPSVQPPQIVMVLGAGRGPLVNATLNAAERTNCPVRVYVIEKNPNALHTLRDRMNYEWRGLDVHLVHGDMRELKVPEKADIFVSELLGSFGDNELSPECLDGAQHLLKDDGISIPCSYTSYVTPLQSLQIYNETKRSRDAPNKVGHSLETPYVVRLLNCRILGDPQPAFTFQHPKKGRPNYLRLINQSSVMSSLQSLRLAIHINESNSRTAICSFQMDNDAVVHGLAGYFEAVLYKQVTLSTHPQRHSPEMVSWFPLVFPLDRPVHVKTGERVTLNLWRVVSSRHVWYEWALTEPYPTRIHNAAGQAYKIAL